MKLCKKLFIVAILALVSACSFHTQEQKMVNPVVYFEIPVNDVARAQHFYEQVFGFDFKVEKIDGYEMALFPFSDSARGISGALAKGDVYKPTKEGVILYFYVTDITNIMQRALAAGGYELYAIKEVAPQRFVGEFADSEGNRIALLQD